MPTNWKKYSWKKIYLLKNCNVLIYGPAASLKDVQATGEAFSPQKEYTIPYYKKWNLFTFFNFFGSFCCSGSWSGSRDTIESGCATPLNWKAVIRNSYVTVKSWYLFWICWYFDYGSEITFVRTFLAVFWIHKYFFRIEFGSGSWW